MSIIRAPRQFTIVERSLIDDKRLSWAARGLMIFLRSKPDDWKFCVEELIDASGDNSPGAAGDLEGLIDELLAIGYLERDGRA